ncbi:hypothetical protein AAIR98_001065 [Elusimicrobium simillimum]|uniref:hypothetical protein n=1 Tax=Elusimicrobium simillimum TaxID=3143438 RepID=UPI003C6F0340
MKLNKILNNLGWAAKNVVMGAGLIAVTGVTGALVYNMAGGGNQGGMNAPRVTQSSSAYRDAQYGSGAYNPVTNNQYGGSLGNDTASLSAYRSSTDGRLASATRSNASGGAGGQEASSSFTSSGGSGGTLEGMGIARQSQAQSDIMAGVNEQVKRVQDNATQAAAQARATGQDNLKSLAGNSGIGSGKSRSISGGANQYANRSSGQDSSVRSMALGQVNSPSSLDSAAAKARRGGRTDKFNNSSSSVDGSARSGGQGSSDALKQAYSIRKTLASAKGENVGASFIGDTYQNAGQNAVGIGGNTVAPTASDLSLDNLNKSTSSTFDPRNIRELEEDLRNARTKKAFGAAVLAITACVGGAIGASFLSMTDPFQVIAKAAITAAALTAVVYAFTQIFNNDNGVSLSNTSKIVLTSMLVLGIGAIGMAWIPGTTTLLKTLAGKVANGSWIMQLGLSTVAGAAMTQIPNAFLNTDEQRKALEEAIKHNKRGT